MLLLEWLTGRFLHLKLHVEREFSVFGLVRPIWLAHRSLPPMQCDACIKHSEPARKNLCVAVCDVICLGKIYILRRLLKVYGFKFAAQNIHIT